MSPGAGEQHKGSQMPGTQRGQAGTTGQPSGAQQPRREEGSAAQSPAAQPRQEKGTTGQASGGRPSSEDRQQQHQQKGSPDRAPTAQRQRPEKGTTGQALGGEQQMRREAPSTTGQAQPSGSRAGENRSSVNLNTEQRTRIRDAVLKESNAPRVASVNFSVSVGTVVPTEVRVVRLPAPIVEIYPAWRDYDYFVVGEEIIIVDPRDHRIVAVFT
jgi:hypothetical protein